MACCWLMEGVFLMFRTFYSYLQKQKLSSVAMTEERPIGDPARGALIFKEHCAFCHSFDPTVGHKKGPNLSGIWGRERGSAPGFKYVESDEKQGRYIKRYMFRCIPYHQS